MQIIYYIILNLWYMPINFWWDLDFEHIYKLSSCSIFYLVSIVARLEN